MTIAAKTKSTIAHSERASFGENAANFFVLAVGIGTAFTIHVVGELYLAEVLLLVAAIPLVFLRGRRLLRRELLRVFGLMALWLLGQVIADVYNHIPMEDRLRGTALIIFFGIDLACLLMLLGRNEKRKRLYLVGLVIGSLAAVTLQPSPATADYPWKFGYASGTILLVLLLSSFFYDRRRYLVSGSLILGICAVNLLLNFRGPVLNLLIALVLVHPIIPERFGSLRILPRSQFARVAVLVILAIGAAETAKGLVYLVTEFGFVNEEAQAKNEAQSQAGNLLLGGRPEFLVGLRAAMDSPIVGHGSWAKDFKYLEMLNDALIETGELQDPGDYEAETNGLIPAHSGIVSAWIWAGILGLIFWLYMVWLVGKGIIRAAVSNPLSAPIYMYLLVSMLWNIFFSPFAAIRRMTEAFTLVVIIDLLEKGTVVARSNWPRVRTGRIWRSFPRPTGQAATRSR